MKASTILVSYEVLPFVDSVQAGGFLLLIIKTSE